ncbi:nucleoside triphosphate pyrophosphohydrolase [Rubinisphaera sp. JC750]|uniref:nucleoside triphosphate pyrophosphohydrolase n=1 Tax=Rubinisphaera sp. JC750 TaxID=2898658 RepID=UPI001F2508BD|nr:nucleoside triphosphate pyrophosphohydrolase [Rubinisphaera sp. JC750]
MSSTNDTRPEMGTPPDPARTASTFTELCNVVAKLRSPEGCPWDRKQTLETIKPFTLEETYELLDAIDSGDDRAIVDELGDVLLQVVLDAQIGADEQRFTILDVIQNLTEKLIRRHPHVFGDESVDDADQVKQTWDRIKSQEKKPKKESLLDGLPKDLPGLARAARLQEKAAKVGYDFPHRDMLFEKLDEELDELHEELFENGETPEVKISLDVEPHPDQEILDEERRQRAEGELGDVLFVLANIARRWKLNPEEAIRKTNTKFQRRFQAIERGLKADNREIASASLAEMEEYYQKEKARERQAAKP